MNWKRLKRSRKCWEGLHEDWLPTFKLPSENDEDIAIIEDNLKGIDIFNKMVTFLLIVSFSFTLTFMLTSTIC